MRRTRVALALLAILMGLFGDYAAAQTTAEAEAVAAGALRSYSTVYSAGLEWDLAGDVDHDSRATLEYRVSGQSVWTPGLGLVRVDSTAGNMLAGSLLFLAPDTQYDVRVSLTDPDGGGDVRLLSVRTRPLPAAPSGRQVLHVVPGSGGGDGSAAAPFNGVAAAQAAAQPGDTFLLHAGTYGPVRFQTSGTDASYVVWKAAGDGEVSLGTIEVAASHVWLDGLTVRNRPFALLSVNSPTNVVITRCHFLNNHFALYLNGAGTDWYIADNTIVGDTPATSGSFDGEGIDLNSTSGHTVARNSITNVADAISSGRTNVDIFANDIFDTSDDGIEADYGGTNVRIWGNRIHNAVHNGISFQPQSGAPLYIIRNQIVGSVESAFKFRTTDRFVLLHNTIVHWGDAWPGRSMMCCNEEHLLRAYARNNLWISVQGGQIWGFDAYGRDWRTDLDFDGFDWGTAVDPFTYGGWTYPDVWAFANASGLETHGLRVSWRECFEDFRVPGPSPSVIPAHLMTLRPSCGAVDAGTILPNVNDGFQGSAPDLGAHEYGAPAAVYGPRPTVPDNSPPSVALTAPIDGALFTAPAAISISAAATDDDGAIASVDFLANGKEIGRRTTAPWSLSWTEVPDGLYTITARATDDRGAGTASAGATVSV
nr:right-handed parallel beta-helix repeat-containing protein [Acidobacteriota bacterium]